MRYLWILFLVLTISGCQNKAAEFVNSVDIIEQNKLLLERGEKAKRDIQNIQKNLERQDEEIEKLDNTNSDEVDKVNTVVNNVDNSNINAQTSPVIPETFDLPVKFAPQAPNANWDDLHKEACEEAAMITAAKYFNGENLDEQIMENEIQALVRRETKQGYRIDLTADEAAQILKDYFGLKAELTDEVTTERIKRELSLGNLVITPHAGRELGNPYYRQPGPIYHFLVIRGWTKSEFITNDVGTKRGDGYKYKFEMIINTVHDWNNGDVANGQKVMIVVSE